MWITCVMESCPLLIHIFVILHACEMYPEACMIVPRLTSVLRLSLSSKVLLLSFSRGPRSAMPLSWQHSASLWLFALMKPGCRRRNRVMTPVCVALFHGADLTELLRSLSFLKSEPRGTHPSYMWCMIHSIVLYMHVSFQVFLDF